MLILFILLCPSYYCKAIILFHIHRGLNCVALNIFLMPLKIRIIHSSRLLDLHYKMYPDICIDYFSCSTFTELSS
jgi:hypothetical protein